MLRSFEVVDNARRRRQPRVDPGDGAAVGLMLSVGGPIRRSCGEFRERVRNAHQPAVERQLTPQSIQLVEVVTQGARLLWARNAARNTLSVTKGLPSRSPPIQLPSRRKEGRHCASA